MTIIYLEIMTSTFLDPYLSIFYHSQEKLAILQMGILYFFLFNTNSLKAKPMFYQIIPYPNFFISL